MDNQKPRNSNGQFVKKPETTVIKDIIPEEEFFTQFDKEEEKVIQELQPLVVQIREFVKKMSGKSRMSFDEAKVMFDLYNKHTGLMERNYNCDLCAIRIFNELRKV